MSVLPTDESAIVVCEMRTNDQETPNFIQHIKTQKAHHEVLVLASQKVSVIVSLAVSCGADNVLFKPCNKKRLQESIIDASLQCVRHETRMMYERHVFKEGFLNYVGTSAPMIQLYRNIQNAAISNANVFITGESGTGKDLCARAIHSVSERKEKEMVSINCGAISHSLMESAIFGHVKGAFTGADSAREGAAQKASNGVLFLDEIGEMDYELQSKFLRLVQQGVLSRVGSDDEILVDVRFISATNKIPDIMIENNEFREDLFYRLNTIQIDIPPLRKRGSDALLIAEKCLFDFSQQENKRFIGFSDEVIEIINDYTWPGNVRELRNVIHNIAINYDGQWVKPSMIPLDIHTALLNGEKKKDITDDKVEIKPNTFNPKEIVPLKELEDLAIKHAIEICEGNINKAAQFLGVAPSTIYRRMS
ncbi:sigma-54 dependent transcriptional regulator [Oceaniserpentilla sp. 4NH20-0058]